MRKDDEIEKEIIQCTIRAMRRRGRSRMTWIGNIMSWTGREMQHLRTTPEKHGDSSCIVRPTLGSLQPPRLKSPAKIPCEIWMFKCTTLQQSYSIQKWWKYLILHISRNNIHLSSSVLNLVDSKKPIRSWTRLCNGTNQCDSKLRLLAGTTSWNRQSIRSISRVTDRPWCDLI